MIIKEIKLNNFKNYKGKHKFAFSTLNLITGKNGSGKSTLGKDAITFVLYGSTEQTIAQLPTRGEKSASVYLKIEENNDVYEITRSIPTKIEILKNGKEVDLANNVEKQQYLDDVFKNIDYFKKFRMIDNIEGINILEQGKVALRKTLFSFNQDLFNSIRQKLLDKKREREIYNKDKAVIYKHYPSEKRLEVLIESIKNIQDTINDLNDISIEHNNEYSKLISKRSSILTNKNWWNTQKSKITNLDICPTCSQKVTQETKKKIIEEATLKLKELQKSFEPIEKTIQEQDESNRGMKLLIQKEYNRKGKVQNLVTKLESRLKQIDYKYTTKDVEIIKKAIDELDKFLSYYITEWVKILEPMINSIIDKIGFEVSFKLSEKGDLDIQILKDKQIFNYKDLSSGQRLILSLSFQLALLLNYNETGLIIADEGFSSLDEKNLKLVWDLIRGLPFQMICVLHRLTDNLDEVHTISL